MITSILQSPSKRGALIGSLVLSFALGACIHSRSGSGDETAGPPPSKSGQLLEQGDALFRERNYGEAGETYELAAAAAETEGHTSNHVEALAQVARAYSIRNLGEEGKPWLERAAALASSDEPRGWSRYLLVKGVYQREEDNRESATATFENLYNYCLIHDLHRRAVNAAHMLAIAAEPEAQINWGLKGIRAAEAGGFDEWLGPLWNNLGWTYEDLGRNDESLDALIKAREYHWKGGSDHAKLVADWSVGHACRMVGELKQAATRMEATYQWAEQRYEENPTLIPRGGSVLLYGNWVRLPSRRANLLRAWNCLRGPAQS